MANYLNPTIQGGATKEGIKSWSFKKDAIILDGHNISLTNFNADMNTHKIQIKGSLTLTDMQEISGSGEAVILVDGGTLSLNKTDTVKAGIIQNTSSGYAIAVSEENNTKINWNNNALKVISAGEINKTIQGISKSEDNTEVVSPSYLTIPSFMKVVYNDTEKSISLVSKETSGNE